MGQNVARFRETAGLTQEKLAEKIDVNPRYVRAIELGERNPSIDIFARLRRALNCTWNDLFEGI